MLRIILGFGFMPLMMSLATCNAAGPRSVTLTEQDTGSTVELNVGDTLHVALADNPTTGFTWEPESLDTTILEQNGWEYRPDDAPSGVSGTGGTLTLHFEAVSPGEVNLRLIYHQPFGPETPPAQTFEVSVIVKTTG